MFSLAEEETSMLGVLARQTLRTHRPFKATIMDKTGQPVLWVRFMLLIVSYETYRM